MDLVLIVPSVPLGGLVLPANVATLTVLLKPIVPVQGLLVAL